MEQQDNAGTRGGDALVDEPLDAGPASTDSQTDDDGSAVSRDIGELKTQLTEATDRHLRLAADFDNYRRRVERDRSDQLARAQAGLVTRLLDVLDDLERFAHHADPGTSPQALMDGVHLIERKMRQTLESAGLQAIDAEGRFTPESMEAVASVPTDSPDEDDTVADVFQKGYRFGGNLIRPARVRVRKHEG